MMKQIYRSLCFASVFFVLLGFSDANAQTRVVTGKISDASGQGIPGVNVIKKGTTTGATTDVGGNFSIDAASEDVLVISFIGYLTEEVNVGNQTKIDVMLNEDIATLQEVVVVGYGEQRKVDVTGSVVSVSAEDIKGSVVANLDQALQGRVAGVQITQNSGAPGAATTVNIRGISSVSGTNQPLYVIDGIQFVGSGGSVRGFTDGGNGQTVVNPLSSLNPNDIATVDVLKDASATAIYGSRASNGVIIITTKRGKAGESKIAYSGQYGVASIRKKLDMMNLRQYADYRNEVAQETNTVPENRFLDPSLLGTGTHWQDEIFRPAVQQSHSITASGGSEKTQYAIMGGYFKQDGIVINSYLKRFNTRINIDSKVNNWFKIGTSIAYASTVENMINDGSGDGVFSQALAVSPDVPVRNPDGTYAGPPVGQNSSEIRFNPVAVANMRTNKLDRQRLTANTYADISLLKNLNFRSEIGFDNGHTQSISFSPTYRWGSLINTENQLQDQRETSFNWIWKNYFTYNLTSGKHSFVALLGAEAVEGRYQNIYVLKKNLATNDIHVLSQGDNAGQTTTGAKNRNTLSSYFARLNYNFGDRYLLTFTLRNDGSSRFGPANRRGYFPAASLAWRISNESFMPESGFLTDLKLRAGYGEVGNQNIPNYAYGSALVSVNSPFGTTYKLDRLANPNVQWEASVQTNVGLDISLMQDRFNITVDVYKKSSKNFLIEQPIPLYLGGGAGGGVFPINAPFVNLGQMQNKGIDLSFTSHNIKTADFEWETSVAYTSFRNEIKKLDDSNVINSGVYLYGVYTVPTRSEVGKPVGQFYGYVTDGIFKTEQEIRDHAVQVFEPNSITTERPQGSNLVHRNDGVWLGDVKFKDLNGDGVIDSKDQTYIGNPNPKFTFGFNNHFSYKAFTLGIFLTGSYGGDIFNASKIRTEGMQNLNNNQAATVTNRAHVDLINPTGNDTQDALDREDITKVYLSNPNAEIPRFSALRVNGNDRIASDRWIEDGSYLRVQNITLGYTLPSSFTQRAKINYAKVYVNIQNAFVFTNYSNFDPEIGANNQNALQQSVDTGRYPTPKVLMFGIDITL